MQHIVITLCSIETAINITTQGKKHVGAVMGSRLYLTEYVHEKVEESIKEITRLSEFAITERQASYDIFFSNISRYTGLVTVVRECNSQDPSTDNYSARMHPT